MLPGPTFVLKCLDCTAQVTELTTASGNTFGAIFYTDGYREAPMMPTPIYLVRCPGCNSVNRLKDLERVDSYSLFSDFLTDAKIDEELRQAKRANGAKQRKYEGLPDCESANETDYFDFARTRAHDIEEEVYLRITGWRIGNHARRTKAIAIALNKPEEENLRRLLELVEGEKKFPQILVVEMYRELGKFIDAKALLSKLSDPSSEISDFERENLPFYETLVKNCDVRVQRLPSE
jgi:hypothetical protein